MSVSKSQAQFNMGDDLSAWDDVDYSPIAAAPKEQQPFPMDALPQGARECVEMALTLSDVIGGAEAVAFGNFAASVGALAAADLMAQTLESEHKPLSIYAVGLMLSSARKTALFTPFWRGHAKADAVAHKQHAESQAAYARYESLSKQERSSETAPRKPYKFSARRIFNDITTENVGNRLGNGSPYTAIASSEGGILLTGYSFRSEAAAARMLSVMNELYSSGSASIGRQTGDEQTIVATDAAPTICLLTQPSNGTAHILGAAGAQGFTARALISECKPTLSYGVGARDPVARRRARDLERLITHNRARQDYMLLYPSDAPARKAVLLTDAAYAMASEYARRSAMRAETEVPADAAHMQSRLHRAAEYAIRIAAALSAYAAYAAGWHPDRDGDIWTDETTLASAIVISEWYAAELDRIESAAGMDEESAAANKLLESIGAEYRRHRKDAEKPSRYINADDDMKVNTFASHRAPAGWRGVAKYKSLVEMLLDANALAPSSRRGYVRVHRNVKGG